MRKRPKIEKRKFVFSLLCLNCVAISFNVAAIVAAIPAMAKDLLVPDFLISRIIPAYTIPYGLGALVYAPLARKVSFRAILGWTMALYAISSFLCVKATGAVPFFMIRIICGFSGAAVTPLALMMIGTFFEKNVRGRLVGVFFGCSFVSSFLGLCASGLLDWRVLFYVPFAISLLASFLIFITPSSDLDAREKNPINYLNIIYNYKLRNIFIFISTLSLLYYGVHVWFGVYLSRIYGLDQLHISLFFVLMAVAGFVGQMIGGVVSDKRGRDRACLIGIVVLGGSTMFLAGRFPLYALAVIFVGVSMGWTIGHNGMSTTLTDVPEENRGEVAGLNSAVRFMTGGIGFWLSAPFVEKSFEATFFVLGILMLALSFFVRKVVTE